MAQTQDTGSKLMILIQDLTICSQKEIFFDSQT